jgi:LPXTG-motif cell wall-anchored protein
VLVTAWIDGVEVRNIAAKPDTGAYSLALQKGTYILRATAMSADGTTIASQYYNGVATAEAATPISLTPDQTVTGIDFTLVDAPEPQPEPTITLSAGTIRAGDAVTVSGNGFEPNATIAFELRSDPIALGSLTADADGVLTGSLRIPVGAPVGAHTLVALSGAAVVASAAVDVTAAVVPGGPGTGGQGSEGQGAGGQSTGGATAPRGALAATGAEVPVALVAMGILLATLGAAMARRRRVES